MDWKELSRDESHQMYDYYCDSDEINCPDQYIPLREDILLLFSNALNRIGITEEQISQKNNSYQLDLFFGIKLYTTLNQKYGMDVRLASSEGVWRFLSVCVVPEIGRAHV